jgi:hypothetical protein
VVLKTRPGRYREEAGPAAAQVILKAEIRTCQIHFLTGDGHVFSQDDIGGTPVSVIYSLTDSGQSFNALHIIPPINGTKIALLRKRGLCRQSTPKQAALRSRSLADMVGLLPVFASSDARSFFSL